MLTVALFTGYTFGISAMGYNIVKMKLQDDFENDIRELREYDFQNEPINFEKDLPINCIILAKYTPEQQNQELKKSTPKMLTAAEEKKIGEDVVFSRVISFSNVLDPTKYFEHNFRKGEQFTMKFRSDEVQQYPLDVEFKGPVKLFDLETIGQAKSYSSQTIADRVKRLYYETLRKRDFEFQEKGILHSKENEYLVCGKLEFDRLGKRLFMRRPDLVIGSDRLDFYDFLGRRKETMGLSIRNWLKFCMGITAAHFLLVRVPTMFSQYFGDEVGVVSEKLGATNEVENVKRAQRIKQHQQNKEANQ